MSGILFCDHCEAPVDVKADPAAIVDLPAYFPPHLAGEVICERCRERAWDRKNEQDMEESF